LRKRHTGATLTPVETRPLGSLHVSVVGLGCNNFGSRLDVAAASWQLTSDELSEIDRISVAPRN